MGGAEYGAARCHDCVIASSERCDISGAEVEAAAAAAVQWW